MNRRQLFRAFLLLLAFGVAAGRAAAQQLIVKGEFGLKAGAQPPPGLYAGLMSGIEWNSEFRTDKGNTLPSAGHVDQYLVGPLVSWVTPLKVLGGNYGMLLAVPFANTAMDIPHIYLNSSTSWGLSQIFFAPVSVGWHFGQADLIFQYGFYAPTGRYTPLGSTNTGLGMWANELSLLSTVYLDGAKEWHLSASVFYDINSKKKDVEWTQGNPFTLMWGLGRNYGSGPGLFKGWAGVAGYAQWQATATSGRAVPSYVEGTRIQIYGVGPEFTTLEGALTVRYFWQFGGVHSLQGSTLYVQFVMPIKL
ncbi:MAG TPA: transporter [Thermoanaerobaculia bacterium]|nr:transporter [Thermoanaerobaculia bacterium]HQR65826.1 transporter [Thermoanaerobaculia bacterium]